MKCTISRIKYLVVMQSQFIVKEQITRNFNYTPYGIISLDVFLHSHLLPQTIHSLIQTVHPLILYFQFILISEVSLYKNSQL
jgi:hypothetical protein